MHVFVARTTPPETAHGTYRQYSTVVLMHSLMHERTIMCGCMDILTYVRTSVDKGGMVCPQAALCIDGGVHAPLLFLPATSGVMHSNAESQQKDAKGRMYVFASSSPNIAAGYLVVPNPLPLTAILLFIASLTKAGRGVSPHFSRICLCASCIVLFHSQPRDGWDRYIAPTSGLPCVPE